jgi:hypothetical protein
MRMHVPRPRSLGDALVEELRWVHDMIRRDLTAVRGLADEVAAGLPAAEARERVATLATGGPLWQLKVNCLQHCRFVHAHHHGESAVLFPALRRADPALNPVVDKLEADHAAISGLLDAVEAAADGLDGAPATRDRLAETLRRLATDLLDHLRYEEENISDTMRAWTGWPR